MAEDALIVKEITKLFPKRKWNGKRQNIFGRIVGLAGPKRPVVEGVSFRVRRREIFGIVGPNGSGKSTLIRMVATLLLPDSGTIKVFGYDVVSQARQVRKMINRVSPEVSFFKKLSPMENLIYTARLYGLRIDEAKKKTKEILSRLDLSTDKFDESLEDLSRGMQQKVAIARALLTSPVLLLLDEPTAGLDPKAKRDVQDFIAELRYIHDTTVLLSTHDMAEAERLCDRIAILNSGRIIALGTPQELKNMCQKEGESISLEEVFVRLTGKSLEEDEE